MSYPNCEKEECFWHHVPALKWYEIYKEQVFIVCFACTYDMHEWHAWVPAHSLLFQFGHSTAGAAVSGTQVAGLGPARILLLEMDAGLSSVPHIRKGS